MPPPRPVSVDRRVVQTVRAPGTSKRSKTKGKKCTWQLNIAAASAAAVRGMLSDPDVILVVYSTAYILHSIPSRFLNPIGYFRFLDVNQVHAAFLSYEIFLRRRRRRRRHHFDLHFLSDARQFQMRRVDKDVRFNNYHHCGITGIEQIVMFKVVIIMD